MKTLFTPLRGVRVIGAAVTDDGKEFKLECDDGQVIDLVRPEVNRAKSLVESVLLIDKSSTHYNVEMSHENVREFLKRAEHYNDIPANLSDIVDAARNAIGPYDGGLCNGHPNANNGSFCHVSFLVGNESSRVLYVRGHRSPRSPAIQDILRNLKAVGEKFNADENQLDGEVSPGFQSFTWRFWWD
jgi:hypothetical protein